MATRVTLHNTARVTKRTPTQTTTTNISRLTYQALGSLIQNKKLIERDTNGSVIGGTYTDKEIPLEYIRVLDELNNLFLKRNYPLLYGSLTIAAGIEELDEYLGSLGVTEEYPYSKDSVDIPAWVTKETPTPIRVLMDESDNTYLTDSNGTEVLVRYV